MEILVPYVYYQAKELQPLDKEVDPVFVPDILVILGRGIEKTPTGNWRPTRLVEIGERETFKHTGVTNWKIEGKGDNEVVGGGQSNVYAAREFLLKYGAQKRIPHVVFAAGRPDYLKDEPENVSEGEVMKGKLLKILCYPESRMTLHMLNNNRTTRDDLITSLGIAKTLHFKNIAILTIGLHVPRSWEMMKKILFEKQEEFEGAFEKIVFINSWEVLSKKVRHGATYEKIIKELEQTEAYKRTHRMEQHGIADLRSGRYK